MQRPHRLLALSHCHFTLLPEADTSHKTEDSARERAQAHTPAILARDARILKGPFK